MSVDIITADGKPYGVPRPGEKVVWSDGREFIGAYCDAGTLSPATIAQGAPVLIGYDTGDEGNDPIVIGASTSAIPKQVGVPLEAISVAGWYWFQTKGDCQALVNGALPVALGDFLELITATARFVIDDATTRSVQSAAVAREAYAVSATALKDVYLIGDPVQIAGS